ncbi:MAG: cyclic nucleotide-binding domain-containing protein [Elusimicrobiota bacterium]
MKKGLSALLSVLYFVTNTVFLYSAESNFWEDRRRSGQNQIASLPTPITSNVSPSANLIRHIPSLSKTLGPSLQKNIHSLGDSVPEKVRGVLNAIPAHAASVKEVSLKLGEKNFVVLIQDVHMNVEAQKNIVSVIEALRNKTIEKPISVAVEGTNGNFDFSDFEKYFHEETLRSVANFYLENNLMSAPGHFGMTSKPGTTLVTGIDDPAHYRANVEAYKTAMLEKKSITTLFEKERQELMNEKLKILNKDLRQLDQHLNAYQAGSLSFGDYVLFLAKQNSTQENMELVVEQFIAAYEMEKSLNFSEVERQRSHVIKKLSEISDKNDLKKLLDISIEYQSGNISYASYYQFVKEFIIRSGIDLRAYPAFDQYIRYVLLSDGLQAEKLFHSVNDLERAVIARLCRTEKEKNLMAKSRRLELKTKLLDFSLIPEEWSEYKKERSPLLKHFEDFYEEADVRSEKMVENLLKGVRSKNNDVLGTSLPRTPFFSVFLVGGFHTPEVTSLLRKQRISYAVIQPRITKVDSASGTEYLSIFSREKSPLDKIFEGRKLFLAPEELLAMRPMPEGMIDTTKLGALIDFHTLQLAERPELAELVTDALTSKRNADGSITHTTPDGVSVRTRIDQKEPNDKEQARHTIKTPQGDKTVIYLGSGLGAVWAMLRDFIKKIRTKRQSLRKKEDVVNIQTKDRPERLLLISAIDKIKSDPNGNENQLNLLLAYLHLYDQIGEENPSKLPELLKIEELNENDVLTDINKPSTDVFVIIDGEVGASDFRRGPGSIVGEMSQLTQGKRAYTLRGLTPKTKVLKIPGDQFQAFISDKNSEVSKAFFQLVQSRKNSSIYDNDKRLGEMIETLRSGGYFQFIPERPRSPQNNREREVDEVYKKLFAFLRKVIAQHNGLVTYEMGQIINPTGERKMKIILSGQAQWVSTPAIEDEAIPEIDGAMFGRGSILGAREVAHKKERKAIYKAVEPVQTIEFNEDDYAQLILITSLFSESEIPLTDENVKRLTKLGIIQKTNESNDLLTVLPITEFIRGERAISQPIRLSGWWPRFIRMLFDIFMTRFIYKNGVLETEVKEWKQRLNGSSFVIRKEGKWMAVEHPLEMSIRNTTESFSLFQDRVEQISDSEVLALTQNTSRISSSKLSSVFLPDDIYFFRRNPSQAGSLTVLLNFQAPTGEIEEKTIELSKGGTLDPAILSAQFSDFLPGAILKSIRFKNVEGWSLYKLDVSNYRRQVKNSVSYSMRETLYQLKAANFEISDSDAKQIEIILTETEEALNKKKHQKPREASHNVKFRQPL